MQDSERAAEIARARGIDAGLHLNFTTACSGTTLLAAGAEHHRRVSAYLRSNRLAQVLYHPGLAQSFEYVVKAQMEEFTRLYGCEPTRFDGHHHMHLCANVIWSDLLPAGTAVRRNFSFKTAEKTVANRLYRRLIDRRLAQQHTMSDYFFSLPPLTPPSRLQQIIAVSREYTVELETHPVNVEERRYLTTMVPLWTADNVRIASCYAVGHTAGPCGTGTVVE
jgi:predicted glycoside hydrolase/deacetylase ChbG (UPF0249 family)